ncbi:MAG: YceI family protein [Bdellovibrionaceae bacterium]|nr:YceI family protein [Pseudobdellovibrionaceae bacterium]
MKMSLATLTVALALPVLSFAKVQIAPGTYNIDPMHSKIGFEIPHLVISTVEGKFEKFDGKIVADKDLAKSKVEVNIDAASINTAVEKRDEHLKSPDFFDVAKHAKLSFVSKKVTVTGNGLKIQGALTIKGVSKDVTLDANYLGQVKDGYGNEKIAFKAKTKINRKDFGLTWSNMVEAGPVVGDEVEIQLNIQAALAK